MLDFLADKAYILVIFALRYFAMTCSLMYVAEKHVLVKKNVRKPTVGDLRGDLPLLFVYTAYLSLFFPRKLSISKSGHFKAKTNKENRLYRK